MDTTSLHATHAAEALHTTTVAGRPIHYRVAGRGSAPPLLLVHGWGGSSRYWRGTLRELADRGPIYAIDLPGFGVSPAISDEATSRRMAEVVIAFADALGLEQFDLNGHSFSAGVAVRVAANHPERVRRLVLTCVSTFRNEAERLLVDQIHKLMALWMALRRPWMAEQRVFYRRAGKLFFYRMPSDDRVLAESFADFLKMEQRTAMESAASSSDPAIHDAMRGARAPTLLIGARQDNIMPPSGTPFVAELVPDCRLHWIERCGHLPMIERPQIYHRLLRRFLDQELPHRH
jgi:pimeloyl-ACP methyl ester carboxylesterase